MSRGRKEDEIDWLLAELRREVRQLHQLERAPGDESDLHISRQKIAELHWRLARLAGDHSQEYRRSAAALSERKP